MDTSKEYFLMCEKAREIRKQWNPKSGDWFLAEHASWVIGHSVINAGEPVAVIVEKRNRPLGSHIEDPKIWLPRQDQLQDMVQYRTTWFEKYFRFYEWANRQNPDDWGSNWNKFISMEQLWLAFVMKEKYNKIWNGKEWEKKSGL